ncbi:MAG: PIG-L family deacetylase [Anaerolineae bacterium]|nr:PIG-L family deacetylase [Anaerolineae bacterium]
MVHINIEPDFPERALVIAAHPDDIEFVVAGTVAKWVQGGTQVRYVLATSGDAGTHQPGITRQELARIREMEQRAAAHAIGVDHVVFLGYPDGEVQPTLDLRRDLVREIRRFKPDTVVCFDPTRLFVDGMYINHPDHRAVGQAAIDAVSPTAAMPLAFAEQLTEEGLEPHRVRQVLVTSTLNPDTWVDISTTIDLKIEALLKHASQMDERRDYVGMIHQWAIDNGVPAGVPYAESFLRIVRPAHRMD